MRPLPLSHAPSPYEAAARPRFGAGICRTVGRLGIAALAAGCTSQGGEPRTSPTASPAVPPPGSDSLDVSVLGERRTRHVVLPIHRRDCGR
ncbi:MAG: hypothetical protein ACJ72W_18870 [Actinoallomurus sp.]